MRLMKLMSKLHAQQNEMVLIRTKQLILKVNDQQCLLLLIVLTFTQDYPKNFFLNKITLFSQIAYYSKLTTNYSETFQT